MRSLYWFRTDLRIADNAALAAAMQHSDFLLTVFILTPATWKRHSVAPAKIQFLLENLKALSKDLWLKGIPLLISQANYFSDSSAVLDNYCKKYKIDNLYFTHEYLLDEERRDKAVLEQLRGRVSLNLYHQQLIFSPGTLLTQQNKAFQVFTPFKRLWLMRAQEQQAWQVTPEIVKKFRSDICPDPIPDSLPGFEHSTRPIAWQAGEKAAEKKLKQFCKKHLALYHEQRDYPQMEATSQLSPYLTQGVLSPRQCLTAALASYQLSGLSDMQNYPGISTWVSELIWREFYYHIIYFHPNICRHKAFKVKTDKLPWRNDATLLIAWKKGLTGFPIVDAGMRQLLETGWMHNRLRMITAMFLSKILLLDWRLGEKHFMSHLVDGDFAANNGGWQWCASTGTDAAPYFRIFNPVTQSQRFDPAGHFIRKFCPELAHLDDKSIHSPFDAGIHPSQLNYPKPIVDYKLMRQTTITLFKEIMAEDGAS